MTNLIPGFLSGVPHEAAGYETDHPQLVIHGKVEFPENFSLSPNWCCSRFVVKPVLHSSRLEAFDPNVVQPYRYDALLPVLADDQVVQHLSHLVPVGEGGSRCPLSNLSLWRVDWHTH